MSNLKSTIVIPVYNQYNALKKVLLSFMKQTIAADSYEIVVIDDGSDDELKYETSNTLSDKYNIEIMLYHQENQGRAAARNMGIALAKYEVIIFCIVKSTKLYKLNTATAKLSTYRGIM